MNQVSKNKIADLIFFVLVLIQFSTIYPDLPHRLLHRSF